MATSPRSMSGDLSRRGFIKSTAAAASGLVIACYLPGCSKPEEMAKQAGPPKLIKANAFLQIGTDGSITMFCDKSEMGQGVYTALPTLLAEELGVAPAAIKVEFAPPGNEYVNKMLGAQATGGRCAYRPVSRRRPVSPVLPENQSLVNAAVLSVSAARRPSRSPENEIGGCLGRLAQAPADF